MHASCISLTTDYGAGSEFVGACHGVALQIARDARIIDLCHTVTPHQVREGAYVLEHALSYLPHGVHVAVVDPGVGGERRPIAIRTRDHVLIGPDNGILMWAAQLDIPQQCVVLDNDAFWLTSNSQTFDGRDIFVPVAAHICAGAPFETIGSPIDVAELTVLDPAHVRVVDGTSLEAEVMRIDGFGNVATAATFEDLNSIDPHRARHFDVVSTKARHHARRVDTFSDGAVGELLIIVDSAKSIALSVNLGRADRLLGVSSGERLFLSVR